MGLNDNTLNKEQTQKRILLATLLSFAFFIAYDFLYVQPKQQTAQQQTAQTQTQSNKTSKTSPQTNTTTQQAPNSKTASNISSESKIVTTIQTSKNTFLIDNLGRISQVVLKDKQYITKDGDKIKLFTPDQLKPLEVRFANNKLNEEAFKTDVQVSSSNIDATIKTQTLTITQKLSSTTLIKKLVFYPDGHYDITINTTNEQNFFISTGYRPNVLVDVYADHGALMVLNDDTLQIIKDKDMDKPIQTNGVQVASEFDRYYTTTLYNFNKNLTVSAMMDDTKSPQLFIHANTKLTLSGYIGPKEYETLKTLDPRLTNIIEYGWFTFIAKPMFIFLKTIHNMVGNWGWTIVLVTIIIKLILFPLSHKGMVSMTKLKELSPKIKAIQEKYADDKQKASIHMMELYQKEGANPMGGCLPVILQIPVFFALYRVLLNAIELKGAPWIFWIKDLGSMDPYYVLPILMGATMYFQQKITPNTMTDPMQQKMFQFLPIIFTFFFLWFPAGLTLYWFINNLITMGQQYYVNNLFEKQKQQRHEQHLKKKHIKK